MKEVNKAILIPFQLHRDLKVKASEQGKSIKEYAIEILLAQINRD
jgi:predicted HicB family RNase H-like nuclease